ncbi:MAG: acyl-CoA thioesterase [Planctomycetota bacterium]
MRKPVPDRSKFKFTTDIRVRLNETDAVGVVFHGNYFTYMDVGRVDYLRNLDLMEQGRPIKGFDNVVAHSSCDFRAPARYDDALVIHVRIASISRTSFRFECAFYRKRTGELLASGESIHVAVDLETMKPVPVPDFFRERIEAFEGDGLEG